MRCTIQCIQLAVADCPKKFHSTFNVLSSGNQSALEKIPEGQEDKRGMVCHWGSDGFTNRIGQMRMTFEGIPNKSYVGTATRFQYVPKTKRTYAITCAHNLMHYDHVLKKKHAVKQAWFNQMRCDVPTGMKDFEKGTGTMDAALSIDKTWIHPDYDASAIGCPNDLAVISFIENNNLFTKCPFTMDLQFNLCSLYTIALQCNV